MAHWRLKIAAAQFAVGVANTNELIDSAHNALDDSVYSYSLGELATFRNGFQADCFLLFLAAMKELQIPIPDHADAVVTLLEYHVIRLVEGVSTPTEILNDLYSIESAVTSYNWRSRKSEQISTAVLEPLAPFIEKYYACKEFLGYQSYMQEQSLPLLDPAGLEKLHAETTSLAVNWVSERWGPAVSPIWLTSTVLALTSGIRDECAFDRLPILADALQDAGCDNEDILNHCRQASEHVRGCFVVNLLLGKA